MVIHTYNLRKQEVETNFFVNSGIGRVTWETLSQMEASKQTNNNRKKRSMIENVMNITEYKEKKKG